MAPSILYMWMCGVMLKTLNISISISSLVHPHCKSWCSVYHYRHLILVPEVLNVPIFNTYDNCKNSMTDFWRECKLFKQVFLVVPICHVHTVCHCKRLPIHLFDHLFPCCNEITLSIISKLQDAKKCCLFMYDNQLDVIWHV